jgi:hypothetical protein
VVTFVTAVTEKHLLSIVALGANLASQINTNILTGACTSSCTADPVHYHGFPRSELTLVLAFAFPIIPTVYHTLKKANGGIVRG